MKKHLPLVLLALLGLAHVQAAVPEVPGPFREGDRWLAVGDSITHSGSYHRDVELFYLTRFPMRHVEVFNCGISGDTATGALARYDWDIAPHHGTVATVMLGMNDIGRTLYLAGEADVATLEKRRERLETWEKNLRALVVKLRADGARVILLTPSSYDQTAQSEKPNSPGANDALAECARRAAAIAAETGCSLVDFHGPMTALNAAVQQADPTATVVGADRIHPGPAGHLALAYWLLRAQGVPGEVAHTEIDATAGKISGAGENLHAVGGGLTWDYVATALPFPVEPAASAALAWVPWTDELNREWLRVGGLAAGSYQLVGDGADVRPFTADELARGVNLAREENTPQMRQAREVLRLLQARATIVAVKLRGIAHVEHQTAGATHPITLAQMRPLLEQRRAKLAADTSPSAPTNRANLEKYIERYAEAKPREAELWAEVARLDAELRRAVVPRKHVFSLRPL